jgi:hypothetical protein
MLSQLNRRCATVVLGVGMLFAIPSREVRAQTNDEALTEIKLLKRIVTEQDRRITELENALKGLVYGTQKNALVQRPSTADNRQGAPSVAQPWKIPSTWSRIRDGMSQAQVVSILGKPTGIENSVTTYFTLFYRGPVPGSGFVSGNVKLVDDRVNQVNQPVF